MITVTDVPIPDKVARNTPAQRSADDELVFVLGALGLTLAEARR